MQADSVTPCALFECAKVHISFHLLKNILLPSLLISQWLLLVKFALFLFLLLQFHWLHETRKPNSYFRVYLPGTLRRDIIAASPLLALPVHVPGHFHWESSHHLVHYHWHPPPHTHVLLSLQPIFFRHLFHLYHHPKDAVEHQDSESSYHLWRLHHTDVFFHAFWDIRQHPLDCDGLWPVCSHLPPIAVPDHHES